MKIIECVAIEVIKPGEVSLNANTIPTSTKGSTSIKPISMAKKATATEPEALEPRAEGKAWHRLDMPLPPS